MINIASCDHGPEFWKKVILDGQLEAPGDQNVAEALPIPAEINTSIPSSIPVRMPLVFNSRELKLMKVH